MNNNCPLCDKPMESLWHTQDPHKKGYHHWCEGCEHGWYVADLRNVVAQNLAFAVSRGKFGKSPERIREIIINKDKEEE